MPYHSTICEQPPLKWPYGRSRGSHQQGRWPDGYPMPCAPNPESWHESTPSVVSLASLYPDLNCPRIQQNIAFISPCRHINEDNDNENKVGLRRRRRRRCQEHMARGGHGLPKVSLGPAMPYPFAPCRRPSLKRPYNRFRDTPRRTPLRRMRHNLFQRTSEMVTKSEQDSVSYLPGI
jgi:hypothetical protein